MDEAILELPEKILQGSHKGKNETTEIFLFAWYRGTSHKEKHSILIYLQFFFLTGQKRCPMKRALREYFCEH